MVTNAVGSLFKPAFLTSFCLDDQVRLSSSTSYIAIIPMDNGRIFKVVLYCTVSALFPSLSWESFQLHPIVPTSEVHRYFSYYADFLLTVPFLRTLNAYICAIAIGFPHDRGVFLINSSSCLPVVWRKTFQQPSQVHGHWTCK